MKDDAPTQTLPQALPSALLVLRITLGLFLLQWGVEKFVVPENTVAIWGYFYGLGVSQWLAYVFGAAEIVIAGCLFLGVYRTAAYGAALALHAVTVLVTWRQLLYPWGDPINHIFAAGVPVLGGFVALFLLRHWDRGLLDRRRTE
ncbi:MAG: DoxX family protein [Geminicoccales bacterium]